MTLPPIDRSGLIATRRDLHQHPELGFEERRTSGLVRRSSNRSEEHTSELQSRLHLVCRLLLEKKKSMHRLPPPSSCAHGSVAFCGSILLRTPAPTSPRRAPLSLSAVPNPPPTIPISAPITAST